MVREMNTDPIVRVFISSTWLDLKPEREAVEAALQRLRETKFVGMEYFGSRDEDTRQASLDEVDRCQLYIGIFAGRYGSGITEAEYRRARERGLTSFIYLKDEAIIPPEGREVDPEKTTLLAALKAELLQHHTVTTFNTPDDLAAKVTADLHRWLFDEYLAPRLERAVRGEFPQEEAQALLAAIKDLSALNQALLAQLQAAHLVPRPEMSDDLKGHLLAVYRRHVLADTEFVNLAGIPVPRDRDGRLIPLHVPLDRVYIRLQAVPEAYHRAEEEAERRALEEWLSEDGARLDTREHPWRSILSEALTTFRTLGKYVYRRGEVYRAEQRPSRHPLLATVHTLGEYLYHREEIYHQREEHLEPTDPEAALREHHRLVILGAPGAGKSTLLRYLARQAAKDPAGPLPILVSLRDYATALGSNPTLSLRDFALDEAAQQGDNRLRQVLAEIVKDGHVLWLVDALDEARGWRGEAARQARDLPGDLVLTSRPTGYERIGLERYPHLEIQPFSPENTDKFLADWFGLLVEQRGADEDWMEERVGWFKRQLAARPRIQPLTRNPLLLTFLVVLAGADPLRELPTHRVELYQRYVEELLDTWETYRRPQAGTSGEPVLHLGSLEGAEARRAAMGGFYRLGWHLHLAYHGGQGAIIPTRSALTKALVDDLRADWNLPLEAACTLMDEVVAFWEEAGVLDRWRLAGEEFLAFRHLIFQEYAATHCLAKVWQKDSKRVWAFLRPRLHHYAWRETVLLMAGMLEDATFLVHRILHARSRYERELHRDLRLAADVISEREEMTLTQVKVVNHLAGLASPPCIWLRRLIPLTLYLGVLGVFWAAFPWWGAVLASFLWNLAWAGMILGLLPRLRSLFWWPTRIFCVERGLRDRNENVRRAASEALGRIGEPAVEPLIQALRDKISGVCLAVAAWVLEQTDIPEAVEPLIPVLEFENSNRRQAAAKTLGRIGGPQIVEPLIQALGDKDKNVRRAAAEALGQIGDPAVEPLLQALRNENWQVRQAASQALGQVGNPKAVEPLIRALGDRDKDVRQAAAEALGQTGDQAVDPLLKALREEEKNVRQAVVEALGRTGAPQAVETLVQVLEDCDEDVRQAAARALGQIGDWQAVEPLVQALEDRDKDVRQAAAEALGRIDAPQAVEPLIQALKDESWRVRQAAAQALGQIGDLQAVEPLIQALGDEQRWVREATTEMLAGIGDPRVMEPVIQQLSDDAGSSFGFVRVKQTVEALGRIGGSQIVEPLIQALGDTDKNVRRAAAEALGQIGDPQVVEPLIQALGDKDIGVRRTVAWALGRLGDPQAVGPLIQALEDKDEGLFGSHPVAQAAAEALGQIGDPQAVGPLIQVLKGGRPWVRQAAACALGQIGEWQAIEPLIQAVKDKSCWVRRAVVEALGNLAEKIPSCGLACCVARALWWRLTDISILAGVDRTASTALERVVTRLTELEAPTLLAADPLAPLPPPRWRRLSAFASALIALVALWLADVLTNLFTELLANGLKASLPPGSAGLILLAAGSLALILLAAGLQRRTSQGR